MLPLLYPRGLFSGDFGPAVEELGSGVQSRPDPKANGRQLEGRTWDQMPPELGPYPRNLDTGVDYAAVGSVAA